MGWVCPGLGGGIDGWKVSVDDEDGGRGVDLDTKEGVETGGVEEGLSRESCQRSSEDGGQSTGGSGVVPHSRASRCHRNIPISREEERGIPGILEADDRVGPEKERADLDQESGGIW